MIEGKSYTSGELFCGAGGLTRGFETRGFSPVFVNDIWPAALHTFLMNFDSSYRRSKGGIRDILAFPGSVEMIDESNVLGKTRNSQGRELQVGDLDVLLGGPPCQGYSVNSHIRSASDPRNFLFRHYIRILRGISPKIFVLENVPGMLSLEGGVFFEELLEHISSPSEGCPGYDIDFKILNAAHYGVPQDRFRIVVVGTRRDVSDKAGKVNLPKPVHYSLAQAHFKGGRQHTFHDAIGFKKRPVHVATASPLWRSDFLAPVTVFEAIGDLPRLSNGGGENVSLYDENIPPENSYQRLMRSSSKELYNHWCRKLAYPNTERVRHIPVGGDWRSLPRELLPSGMQRALRKDHTKRYGRFAPNDLSGTILTKPDPHWGTFIHYDEDQDRLISVREAARLQSFPDHHMFYGGQVDQYKLCGNAVPPLLAEAVANEVRSILDIYCSRSIGGKRKASIAARG
ncbi:DNA cytosine methyltransferase [Rhizobium leguminosarum]|nr:DNA cytosine methyltransferase [Rhizobium leguminosarum]